MKTFERNQRITVAALAVALAWGGSADALAGVVSADLRNALQVQGGQDVVPVIITFADKVNPGQFRGKDRRGRRAELVQALRDKAGRTQGQVAALLQGRGGKQIRQLWLNNSLAAKVPAAMIPELEAMPGIESIRADAVVTSPVAPAGAGAVAEWNVNAIHAPDVWSLGFDGTGTVVANMDTGVDASHPDLAARWRGGANSWYDPNGEHAAPSDAQGHGTQTMGVMVGGTASGTAIGVAPGAQWIAVKIFNDAGQASLSNIHLGFQWLLDPDGNPATLDAPDVVNNSWGLQNSGGCNLEFNTDIQVLKAAGINVVFSGGNSGPSPLSSESPANNPEGFAVGALDSASNVASFSSQGPSACDGTFFPELSAPGVDIKTADLSFGGLPNYATVSGTSFAAPHVAGALALLAQAFPTVGVTELEAAVTAHAQDLGLVGPDSSYGYGLVDVVAAFNAIAATTPPASGNRPPAAVNDAYSVAAGSTLSTAAPGVLGNDSDPDGTPLTAVLATAPTGGSLTLNANGSFSYTPGPGTTSDTFAYQASDGVLQSNPATVSISVIANQAPVAANDAYSARVGSTLSVAAPGVLGNDSDPEGSPLSATLVSGTSGGTLTLNANGSLSYTPRLGTSADSFTYRVSDGALSSNTATVSIAVAAANKAPVARNDSAATSKDTAITINVIANDTDADGTIDPATVSVVSAPTRGGSVTPNGNGTVSYTPKLNFYGIESFGYTVKDNLGTVSNKATVTVTVRR